LSILHTRHPSWSLPGRSTVCDILRRHGLVPKKRHRRHLGHPGKPITVIAAPNDVWSADFNGQFNTGDGLYCYPLTVADGHRRVRLGCQALSSTRVAEAKPVFARLFNAFGWPKRIRPDNGGPLATNTLGRLSQLSAWWVRLGILPACIEPGKPQQNGRHERMQRTLKAETTRPPARTRRAQQFTCDRFREAFNGQRPHEALDMRTPAAYDDPSPRTMPHTLPPLEYPDRFEGRYVSANGGIRWHHHWVNVAHTCVGAYVGLEDIDDGVWYVDFGPLTLGRLLERHLRIEEASGRLTRRR
jgi:transposase InsO family protein